MPQRNPFRLFQIFLRPFLYFSLPAVVWSGFAFGLSLVWTNVMNATASSILSAKPYKFTPSQVGLTYLAPLLGSFISALYTGVLGDWWALRMARRNGGIMEAEHRLWLFGISCIAMPFALVLWGVGAAHHVHWFGIVVAIFVKGLQSSMTIAVSVTYTLDSYRDIAGEAIVTVILIRNTMSFAVNYGSTPWVTGMGLQNTFILAAVLSFLGFLTFLPMTIYGKRLREKSVDRYRRYVEQEKRLGLVH